MYHHQPSVWGDILLRQPSEREIYLKQIESWEQSWLLGYRSVNDYVYWKQYWEANDLDDIRLEEYEMHIYGKTEKVFLKWGEGADGAGEFKKERQENVKTEYCRVCQTLQHQVRLWVVYNAAICGTFLIQQKKVDTHFLVFPFWRHFCTFYIHYFFLCYH